MFFSGLCLCVFPVHFLSTFLFFFLNSGLFLVCFLVLQVVFEMENKREWSLVNGEIGKFWKEVREWKPGSAYIVRRK